MSVDVSQLDKEWATVTAELAKMEKAHEDYLHKLTELTKQQENCQKAIKHQHYLVGSIKDTLGRATSSASTDSDREVIERVNREMAETRAKLKEMQTELPVQNIGFYLSLILGHNLNLSLLTSDGRYKYKQDYESFKWRVTCAVLLWVLVSWLFPWRVIDSMGNFLMVWYYCTLTIRESILTINGSKIKGWWVMHHYISCVLSGIVLIWKEGDCYRTFRPQFLLFVAYICLVQLMQNQYQSGCLRRLHSLGQGHQMDITLEGFTGWMFKGLTFLLPFLILGYFFQLYNAYTLWLLSQQCPGQWQVLALCYLFLVIAVGNIYTTSLVILRKFRSSGSYAYILSATSKYRMRTKNE